MEFKEALSPRAAVTLGRNKLRSVLTLLGVVIGVGECDSPWWTLVNGANLFCGAEVSPATGAGRVSRWTKGARRCPTNPDDYVKFREEEETYCFSRLPVCAGETASTASAWGAQAGDDGQASARHAVDYGRADFVGIRGRCRSCRNLDITEGTRGLTEDRR